MTHIRHTSEEVFYSRGAGIGYYDFDTARENLCKDYDKWRATNPSYVILNKQTSAPYTSQATGHPWLYLDVIYDDTKKNAQ